MKIIGAIQSESKVLVEMSDYEFELLTGCANSEYLSHSVLRKEIGFTTPVKAALKLLTLRKQLDDTAKSLEAVAELCRTPFPIIPKVDEIVDELCRTPSTSSQGNT